MRTGCSRSFITVCLRRLSMLVSSSTMLNDPVEIKAEIIRLAKEFSRLSHGANRPGYEQATDNVKRAKFVPGQTTVPYAGRVFDENEVAAAVSSTLDFWLTLGKEGEGFEAELAQFLGVKNSIVCN